jgi:RHS repeat-associated protein
VRRPSSIIALVARIFVTTFLSVSLLHAGAASAEDITQGWAGIDPAQGFTVAVPYDTPQDACASMQYSFVPAFGHKVYDLISVNPYPDTLYNGVLTPAYLCQYHSETGFDGIITLYGCSGDYKLINGACLPDGYPVTAEPTDCPACKGAASQFPVDGDPVSLSTGAKDEEVTDYTSGGPHPIEIKRYYRSEQMPKVSGDKGLGLGWRTDIIGRRLRVEAASGTYPYNVVVTREDGEESRFLDPYSTPTALGPWNQYSMEVFYVNGQESVAGVGDAKDKLKTIDTRLFEYTDENDRVDTLPAGGSTLATAAGPIKSVWRGGYTRNYVYDSTDTAYQRPIQITDSLGRVINISWNGNLISEIDTPDGVKIEYSYTPLTDANGQAVPGSEVLTQVARYKADGTLIDSTGYQYDRTRTGTTVPLLTGIVDAKGVVVDSTTYDSTGRVLSAQGPGGADAITISYDDTANTRSVTNALGQVTVYTVQPDYNPYMHPLLKLSKVERQASGTVPAATLTQSDSATGFLDSRTDFNGVVTNYSYDATGNETQRVEDANGLARTTSTTWSPDFRLPTQIVEPNLTVNLTYDSNGNLIKREEIDTTNSKKPVSRVWTYTWNNLDLLTSATGPRTDIAQTTSYTYDANGNLSTVIDALNHVTTVNAVNTSGLPTSITDQNGVVTLMTYDPLGRISTVSVQGPTPATTSFGYDSNGLLTSVQSPNGATLTYGYDQAHRLTTIQDSLGNAMVFGLDGLGDRIETQVQSGTNQVLMESKATFDSLGRLLTSIGAANQTTSYGYDANGNETSVTDPRSAVTQSAFDGLNRVKQVTDALGGVTQLAYDGQDNVTSVTDANGHVTTYTINGFGFVTEVDSPDSGATKYDYDLAGNVVTRTDARKVVTNYTYDALDRPLTRTYPSDPAENVAYGYDDKTGGNFGGGRLTSVTDAAGTAKFTYDAYGNRISETRTIGGNNYTTGYGYDLAGNVTRVTYPSGLIVSYARDSLGQVSGVTVQANAAATPVPVASNISYLPFGPMQNVTLGNGVQVARAYDLDYRLSRVQAAGSSAAQELTFGYDEAGNISSIADAVDPTLNESFQYDLLGRVTQGSGAWGNNSYTYGPVGNRLSRTQVSGGVTSSTTYTYAKGTNQLATETTDGLTTLYKYDLAGSIVSGKTGKGKNAQAIAYAYNADGRLATAGAAGMTYDAFGERSAESVTGGGEQFIFASDGNLLAEYTPQGNLVRNYVYLNGQPLALVDAVGTVSYVLNDQLGQPQKMLDGSGTVTWHRVAGIFGDTIAQPVGSTSANPLRFPGQWADANTGLNYNYFRDYDPSTGRYIETDPIGLRGGNNLYAYVDGNPITRIDPEGLDIAVIENGPTSGNPIGHTAIAISGAGVYSFGNATPAGLPLTDYLKREASRRNTDVYVIKTTPAQDAAALKYLRSFPNTTLGGGLWHILVDNCAARANGALDAAKIPYPIIKDGGRGTTLLPSMPGTAGLRAMGAGAPRISIPRGSQQIPPALLGF